MANEEQKHGPPWGFLIVLVLTAALYVVVLNIAGTTTAGGGEAAFGNAVEALFATAGLWIALAVLLLVGGLMGEMPGRAALAALFLVPMSGVAAIVAIDMCSRHMRGAIIFVALLPLLIAFYAAWARMPGLRIKIPEATKVGVAVWGSVLALSIVTFLAAM